MAQLHDLTALEQAAAIRAREVSPADLVEHYLARIGRFSADVGAFVTVTEDLARKQAKLAQSQPQSQPQSQHESPHKADALPLFGVPTAIKDLNMTAGIRTTCGSATMEHNVPASCCGLFGLKPSRGRISGGPMHGDPVGLGTSGSLARTVRDAAAMLDVMAGPATGDPSWAAPLPTGETYLGWCEREPGRLRIARFSRPVIADVAVHPECLEAYENAADLLVRLGHDVEDIDVPIPPDAVATFETCWSVLSALSPAPSGSEGMLRPLTRWLHERGRAVSGPQFGLAVGELRRIAAQALLALAPYDAVLTPTLAQPPLRVGEIRDDDDPRRDFENQKAFTPYTAAWNLTGMPAVSLPLHMTPGGLPVGVMLAGRPGEDHRLLALAAQVEAAAPWYDRLPKW